MQPLDTILAFLDGIGLPPIETTLDEGVFLPGLRIDAGRLLFDRVRLRWPGDLLHEAGHLAVMPARLRGTLSDDVAAAAAVPHAGEVEATAWAYAATVHLGLPASVLFHEGGYRGHSAAMALGYELGVYPGAHGLAQAGMTCVGAQAQAAGVAPYPRMQRWLRE